MLLPGISSRELKTHVHIKICIQMFIVAFLMLVKKWKQLKCASTDEWINKIWYI